MLSKFKKYAEFGAAASPPNQRRQPLISSKPNAFSLLLLEISKQFEVEDEMNFRAFLEDYGQEDDKGALTAEQIQKQPTIYRLLMECAKVGFIQSDDLSNLEAFLDICGHCALVQEIQEFQTQQDSTSPSDHRQFEARVNYDTHQGSMEPLPSATSRMLSKSRKYTECGATASPPNQRRKPSVSAKPSAFRLLLLEISKHLGEEDVQNFKAYLEDYARENDKGAVVVDQLQEVTTAFCLLMASAKVGFIQPDNLSNLMAFLDVSGHSALAQEIENFQENEQNAPSPTDEAGVTDHLQQVEYSPHHIHLHPTTHEQPGNEQNGQSSHVYVEVRPEQPTDDEGQLGIAPLGVARQQQKILPFSLAVSVNIPDKLQEAMKFIVIGHYVEVFRSINYHIIKRYSESFAGFIGRAGVTFDFGLGTTQHLPVQALNHLACSDEYESILQLIMEAILIAPNPEENLAIFLAYVNLRVPEPLKLLYRARLPSVAMDKKLQDELATQSRHLADQLRDEQQQTNFAPSKNALYLSQVYDATAHINRHQMKADFRTVFMQKADYHERAMIERHNYQPRTPLEKAILKLESTRSAQSQGYAYAQMATNGPERDMVRREHAEKARQLHEDSMYNHATPLLQLLGMHNGMSEGAALVANLRFDEMLRILRPAQLDYKIHHKEWSEEERERKLQYHLALVVNEFDRIRDQLSSCATAIPVLQELLKTMEDNMVPLKEEVASGCIKGFALNNATMSE